MEEITVKQLLEMDGRDYLVVDIRDSIAFAYGSINGAVNVPADEVENYSDFPTDKLLVICCKSGVSATQLPNACANGGSKPQISKRDITAICSRRSKPTSKGQRMSSAV